MVGRKIRTCAVEWFIFLPFLGRVHRIVWLLKHFSGRYDVLERAIDTVLQRRNNDRAAAYNIYDQKSLRRRALLLMCIRIAGLLKSIKKKKSRAVDFSVSRPISSSLHHHLVNKRFKHSVDCSSYPILRLRLRLNACNTFTIYVRARVCDKRMCVLCIRTHTHTRTVRSRVYIYKFCK